MSSVQHLTALVEKCIAGQQELRAEIVRRDRGETTSQAAARGIHKALGDGRGGAAVAIGFDGSDTLGILRGLGTGRQKSLGWGSYLGDLAAGCDQRNDPHVVTKRLSDRWGAKPVQKSSLAEQAGSTGGYTVPVQFYMDLMRLMGEASFCRQLTTTLPMQSRSMFVPAVDQSITPAVGTAAWWGGIQATFQPEGQLITNSQPAFRQLELVARDLVFTCVASNQLLQDNAVALDTVLTTMFQEAMAWFFDWFVLRGSGANQPLGTLNAPCAVTTGGASTTRKTAGEVVLSDLAAMMQHLVLSSWKSAVWVMHPSVLGQLIQMTTAADNASPNQQLVWLNPFGKSGDGNEGPLALASPFSVLGRPVYFSEKVPQLGTTGDVQLLDLSKYLVGDRLALQIETSPHILFQNNQLMWRCIMRWDGQPWMNAPIILGDGGQSYKVSPVVLLGGT